MTSLLFSTVGFAPVVAIKALLGCVLIAAAAKVAVSKD